MTKIRLIAGLREEILQQFFTYLCYFHDLIINTSSILEIRNYLNNNRTDKLLLLIDFLSFPNSPIRLFDNAFTFFKIFTFNRRYSEMVKSIKRLKFTCLWKYISRREEVSRASFKVVRCQFRISFFSQVSKSAVKTFLATLDMGCVWPWMRLLKSISSLNILFYDLISISLFRLSSTYCFPIRNTYKFSKRYYIFNYNQFIGFLRRFWTHDTIRENNSTKNIFWMEKKFWSHMASAIGSVLHVKDNIDI